MSRYKSLSQLMAQFGSGHRSARVLRFVHRHPDSHRKIIGMLRRRTQRQQRRAAKRFRQMQATA